MDKTTTAAGTMLGTLKLKDWTWQDWTLTDEFAGLDIATMLTTTVHNEVPAETWTTSVSNVGRTTSVGSNALSIGQFLLLLKML